MNKDKIVNKTTNLKIDRAMRIYTVYTIPQDDAVYGIKVAETYITSYLKDLDKFFYQFNLHELIGLVDLKQLDEMNYLIVLGFSKLNSAKLYSNAIKLLLLFATIGTILYFYIR